MDKIEREIAPIEVTVFNIGANVRITVADSTERVCRQVWEMGALSGFLLRREVACAMLSRGPRTILFTGATASLRRRQALRQRANWGRGAPTWPA